MNDLRHDPNVTDVTWCDSHGVMREYDVRSANLDYLSAEMDRINAERDRLAEQARALSVRMQEAR